jgi:hypothetical protein
LELQKQPDVYAKTHLLTISFDPEYDHAESHAQLWRLPHRPLLW